MMLWDVTCCDAMSSHGCDHIDIRYYSNSLKFVQPFESVFNNRPNISARWSANQADPTDPEIPPAGKEDPVILRARASAAGSHRVTARGCALHWYHPQECQHDDGRRPTTRIHGKNSPYLIATAVCTSRCNTVKVRVADSCSIFYLWRLYYTHSTKGRLLDE